MKHGVAKRALGVALASVVATSTVGVIPGVDSVPGVTVKADGGAIYVDSADYYNSAYDNTYAYNGNDLGCTYTSEQTTFKVWSPEAEKVQVHMYATGSDEEEGSKDLGSFDMKKAVDSNGIWKGVWEYTLTGDHKNEYYTYQTTIGGETYKEAVDIYAKAVGVNGKRGMVVDLDSTDPENWDDDYKSPAMSLSDSVIWEIDIRDFSISVTSGVSEENRGKFKAFTESTTVNGEGKIASCVDYLKKMGVTHVQILPTYDFASVDETKDNSEMSETNYNWGYDPQNYNAPEGSYSSNPYDGNVRIKEMKEMIQALHDAGIQVVMDVVYNHTYATNDSNFNLIMPDYYYKLTESNGSVYYDNQSGCGNATRSTSAMYRKFMIDSVTYWADEYHIDGFRFDLMGIHDWKTMNTIRDTLDEKFGEDAILMYGEGWTGGDFDKEISCYKTYCRNLDPGIGYFNDQIRDAIKGETADDKKDQIGFAQQNLGLKNKYTDPEKFPTSVFGGIMGSVGMNKSDWWMWRAYWSDTSARVLSYDSCHDNQTVWDKFADSLGEDYDSKSNTLIDMSRMTAGYLLTSHGGTFLCGGEEFARTKQGDENSYKSGDLINALDWSRIDGYDNLTAYYQGMIEIRKAFSGFRTIYTERANSKVAENTATGFFNKVENSNLTEIKEFTNVAEYNVNTIGYYLSNDVAGEWNKVAVLLNNTTQTEDVELKDASQWVLVSNGKQASVEGVSVTKDSVISVPGKSVVVAVPKDTFDQAKITSKAEKLVDVALEPIDPAPAKPATTPAPVTPATGGAITGGALTGSALTGTAISYSKLTVTPTKYQTVNKKVNVKVSATGGMGALNYRYYIYNGSTLIQSSDWTSESTFQWTPKKAGNYKIVAKVRDEAGNEQQKTKTLSVISKKVSVKSVNIAKKKGKKIVCKVSAAGGKQAYKFSFQVKTAKGKSVAKTGFISKGTWTCKVKKAGTYKVSVTVKDQLGMKATKTVKKVVVK